MCLCVYHANCVYFAFVYQAKCMYFTCSSCVFHANCAYFMCTSCVHRGNCAYFTRASCVYRANCVYFGRAFGGVPPAPHPPYISRMPFQKAGKSARVSHYAKSEPFLAKTEPFHATNWIFQRGSMCQSWSVKDLLQAQPTF